MIDKSMTQNNLNQAPNQWIEVSLSVDGEAAEAIAQALQQWCYQGVVIEQEGIPPDKWDEDDVPAPTRVSVRGYFPNDDRAETTKQNINQTLRYMNMMYPMPTPVYSLVNEQDWAEAWKSHYKPVRLGQRILVRPLWIEVQPQPDDIVIALDPGMAFGTGTHPTTQLCLQALEQRVQPALDVLDLGCGSGILAIAAAKLGATNIVAVDIDPIAVKATLENTQQNDVAERITAFQGSLENLITSSRRFDLMIVNILAKVIVAMCDDGLGQLVRPGGRAIFSGIIDTQAEEVEAALRKTGLKPVARQSMGDWLLIEAMRPVE